MLCDFESKLMVKSVGRCCINTIGPTGEGHRVAGNMHRIITINVLYNVIVYQVDHLLRVVPRCTVSKTKFIVKCLLHLIRASESLTLS